MSALPQTAPRDVMDIRQAASYLGISADSLYNYASQGTVPAFKLGNRWRFKKDLLDGWMNLQSGVQAGAHPATGSRKPSRSAR